MSYYLAVSARVGNVIKESRSGVYIRVRRLLGVSIWLTPDGIGRVPIPVGFMCLRLPEKTGLDPVHQPQCGPAQKGATEWNTTFWVYAEKEEKKDGITQTIVACSRQETRAFYIPREILSANMPRGKSTYCQTAFPEETRKIHGPIRNE